MIRWFFGNVLTHAKRPTFLYQRLLWYFGHFRGEASKLLGAWQDVAILVLLLQNSGWQVGVKETIVALIILLFLGIIIGRILVLRGIVEYNKEMENSQNPLTSKVEEILRAVKK